MSKPKYVVGISMNHLTAVANAVLVINERVANLEKWSHEPQPVLSPQTFNRDMAMIYEAFNDLRSRIETLERLHGGK